MLRVLRVLLPLLTLILSCAGAMADTFDGRVSAVLEGDMLVVDVPGRGPIKLRLAWIDAPERAQPAGEAARSSLGALSFGREVRIEHAGEGPGGLWHGVAWASSPDTPCRGTDCPKTLDLGMAQIARGMAWHDRRSLGQPAHSLGQYEHAEFQARIRRLGLWAEKNPVPPWQWTGRR